MKSALRESQELLHTGCPQKNLRLLWKAIAPLRIIVVIKVRGDSESTVAELAFCGIP